MASSMAVCFTLLPEGHPVMTMAVNTRPATFTSKTGVFQSKLSLKVRQQ
jgi:hypothetical protein